MVIKLNFINQSNSTGPARIVIFQKNLANSSDGLAVAWQTVEFSGPGDQHPVTFPANLQVGASDSYGNFTPQLTAENGDLFQMALTTSGDRLVSAGHGTNPKEVQVLNALQKGAINASIYRDGRLLAVTTSISPQQKAVFEFKPTIWVGVASQVVQGQIMNSAIVSTINTELPLLGVASANIVMTGGGPGANAAPFAFHFENMVKS